MAVVTVEQKRESSGSLGHIANLTEAYDIKWQQQLSEPGSGTITLPLDAYRLYDIQPNDFLVYKIDDVVVFASIVEVIEEHTLDDEGPGAEWATLDGRGIGAVLEWGVIVPANGIDAEPVESDRLFSWQSAQYVEGNDGQAWDDVVDAGDADGSVRVAGTQVGYPEGAPDLTGAKWIFVDPGDDTFAPGGRGYFRSTLTLGSETTLLVVYAFDNYGKIWFDGQLIGALEQAGGPQNWLQAHTYSLIASAGAHQIAVECVNVGGPSPGPKDNPGGVYVAIGSVDSDGEFNNELLVTNTTDWTALGYPATAPGMTPGEVVEIVFDEVNVRGGLQFLGWDFTATQDTDGTTWPVVGDISTKTGTDILTMLQELAVTYVDWVVEFDPTEVALVRLLVKDGYAQVGGSTVFLEPATVTDPTTGNLLQVDRRTT